MSETKKQQSSRTKKTTSKAKKTTRSTKSKKTTTKKTTRKKKEPSLSLWQRLQNGFRNPENWRQNMPPWLDEVGAFVLIIIGGVILSSLLSSSEEGTLSSYLATGLRQAFGNGAFLVALIATGTGVILLLPKFKIKPELSWMRIMALEVAFISLQGLFHLLTFEEEGRALARAGDGGGYVGWAISSLLSGIVGTWLAIFALLIALGYSAIMFFEIRRQHLRNVLIWLSEGAQDIAARLRPQQQQETALASASQTTARPQQDAYYEQVTSTTAVIQSLPAIPAQDESAVPLAAVEPDSVPVPESRPVIPINPSTRKSSETSGRVAPEQTSSSSVKASARKTSPEKKTARRPSRPRRQSNPAAKKSESTNTEQSAKTESPANSQNSATEDTNADKKSATDKKSETGKSRSKKKSPASKPAKAAESVSSPEPEPEPEPEPRITTVTINGKTITTTLPAVEENGSGRKRKKRRSSGKRYFVVDGYQDKVKVGKRSDELPPLEILNYSELKLPGEEEVNTNAHIIENTMLEFDIDADVIDVKIGPTVTRYAVSPIKELIDENGERTIIRTRVGKIAALSSDFSLALSARRLRIEAPVPGFSYVGIEVPNREPSIVSLRSVLESEQFYKERKKNLALPLGRDVSGEPVVTDLAVMPHLLIAGTTGSGKSVCLTSIISSIIMNNTPQEVQLILLDPKMVELSQFNGLPHLIGPVETDLERIIGVLRWAAREMDRRYKLLEHEGARNLEAYNQILGRRRKDEHMPYIVLVIDEIGDLMMSKPDETEKTLTRLAQKARAAGMHLVIATQRPSVDVVTGLIKANFPARISFAVAAGVDSRVILDTVGAETLMGKGDMLFLAADAGAPIRVQGCYVGDEELDEVVMYWRNWYEEKIAEEEMEPPGTPPWERGLTRLEALSEHDPILEEALKLVVAEGNASASLLQRRLSVSYPRAARLMDSLYELGIIGAPQAGGRTREVLVKSVDKARQMIINNRAPKDTDKKKR